MLYSLINMCRVPHQTFVSMALLCWSWPQALVAPASASPGLRSQLQSSPCSSCSARDCTLGFVQSLIIFSIHWWILPQPDVYCGRRFTSCHYTIRGQYCSFPQWIVICQCDSVCVHQDVVACVYIHVKARSQPWKPFFWCIHSFIFL